MGMNLSQNALQRLWLDSTPFLGKDHRLTLAALALAALALAALALAALAFFALKTISAVCTYMRVRVCLWSCVCPCVRVSVRAPATVSRLRSVAALTFCVRALPFVACSHTV